MVLYLINNILLPMKEISMQKSKNAFTMIEIVFVIVVLGILAAIAVPRLAATRDDATISKGRADVASIRSAIVTERQSRLIKGDPSWISKANLDGGEGDFFGGVLTYGITASSGNNGWSGTAGSGSYTYSVAGSANTFTYNPDNGTFICTSGSECAVLTE